MFFSRTALLATLILISTACSRPPANQPVPRFAILRFENLSAGASADWAGRAFSEIVTAELAAAPGLRVIPATQFHSLDRQTGVRPISAPGISSERQLAILAGATRLGYGDYEIRGGKLRARLTIEDVATGKMTGPFTAESPATDVESAASNLAHQLAAGAGKYATGNAAAVEAYMIALEASTGVATDESAARAIAADPNFAPPYRLLAASKAKRQDLAGALAVLDAAAARGNAFPPVERARNALDAATLRNDSAARRQALTDLVKADPDDLPSWRLLGELAYAGHDYRQAVIAFQKVLGFQPDDAAMLNELAYSQAYGGNLDAALATLHRYQTTHPNDPNALDSTGDVYLIYGRLPDAEKFYLQAYRKEPNFQAGGDLFKAAMAHLMTGDVAGADALEKRVEEARQAAHDPAVPFRRAEWSWISGRRKLALTQLSAFAQSCENGPLKELASRGYSEMAVWQLLLEDRAAADAMLRKAFQFAGPSTAGSALLVRFLLQPAASPAEWTSRADLLLRNPAQAALRDLMLAQAFLMNRQFDSAAPLLQHLYDSGGTADESLPVLLAWADLETGRLDRAAELLRWNPVPPMGGQGFFMAIYFPSVFDLRSRVAEKQGRHEDSRAAAQVFQHLVGQAFPPAN